jgi:hypothetical protein
MMPFKSLLLTLLLALAAPGRAASPDPQTKTDHPWYAGELACSTFDRLFATQRELYERVTGREVMTDEDKALASWYWRNLHFAHGEEGKCDPFAAGFDKGEWNREYWTGLFAHGFALCGTTHAQWTAEMEALLGHCRSRCAGVTGHNSFEVFLTGGAYGAGKWALLDHDISTVIFDDQGIRLLGLHEIIPRIQTLKNPNYSPRRQRGWRVSGLHDDDAGGVYTAFHAAEYLAGYAGPPPRINLRKGESLRRYLRPGLEDGKTFVFWGMNYNTANIPGPERSRTWVNQPEKMFGAKSDTGHHDGQARYANAVFTYRPNFADGSYKEGVVSEDDQHVTFAFQSPYVIAATPATNARWAVYEKGCTNGLRITANIPLGVQLSVDGGQSWSPLPPLSLDQSLDLTDLAKGRYHYQLRIQKGAIRLPDAGLVIRTVCQANATTIPHLKEGSNPITFESTALAHVDAGPAHIVEGKIGSRSVTLELKTPRGEKAAHLYAASWQASGNPPDPKVAYQIDYSTDGGKTWRPVVKDWRIERRPPEPQDFWSQSFTWGDAALADVTGPVRIRFTNTGGKPYRTVEAHLAYRPQTASPTTVTYAWRDKTGAEKMATHTYPAGTKHDSSWKFDAGQGVESTWVEYAAN